MVFRSCLPGRRTAPPSSEPAASAPQASEVTRTTTFERETGISSRLSIENHSIGERILIVFEEIGSGIVRLSQDLLAALGLLTVEVPSGGEPTVVFEAKVLPDPPERLPQFGNTPRGLRLGNNISCPTETYYHVRSKHYLKTRVKARSSPRMFEFIGSETLRGPTSARDICAHPEGIMASPAYAELYKAAMRKQAKAARAARPGSAAVAVEAPFIFCVNFALPRAPQLKPDEFINIVLYFGRVGRSDNAVFEHLWDKFRAMTPQQRGSRLKLLPIIVGGPQAFQNSIANKPTIIGTKLKTTYYDSDHHMECIVDVGSSLLASQMWKLMLPQSKHLAMDIAWVIEGQSEDELPEVVLGCAHISKPDPADQALTRTLHDASKPARSIPSDDSRRRVEHGSTR